MNPYVEQRRQQFRESTERDRNEIAGIEQRMVHRALTRNEFEITVERLADTNPTDAELAAEIESMAKATEGMGRYLALLAERDYRAEGAGDPGIPTAKGDGATTWNTPLSAYEAREDEATTRRRPFFPPDYVSPLTMEERNATLEELSPTPRIDYDDFPMSMEYETPGNAGDPAVEEQAGRDAEYEYWED